MFPFDSSKLATPKYRVYHERSTQAADFVAERASFLAQVEQQVVRFRSMGWDDAAVVREIRTRAEAMVVSNRGATIPPSRMGAAVAGQALAGRIGLNS